MSKRKTTKRKVRPLVKRAYSRWRARLKKAGKWAKRSQYLNELAALRHRLAKEDKKGKRKAA